MKKVINIKETIKQHIINNKIEYIIIALFFIIGIFLALRERLKEIDGGELNEASKYWNNSR